MEQDKVKFLIEMINNMDIKDKLRLSIRMSGSNYTNLKYDKPEMYERFAMAKIYTIFNKYGKIRIRR